MLALPVVSSWAGRSASQISSVSSHELKVLMWGEAGPGQLATAGSAASTQYSNHRQLSDRPCQKHELSASKCTSYQHIELAWTKGADGTCSRMSPACHWAVPALKLHQVRHCKAGSCMSCYQCVGLQQAF